MDSPPEDFSQLFATDYPISNGVKPNEYKYKYFIMGDLFVNLCGAGSSIETSTNIPQKDKQRAVGHIYT